MHPATLPPSDVEAIERATVAAVGPEAIEDLDGWILAFDQGTVGRAKSAAPLSHSTTPATNAIDAIAGRYAARGLAPMLRLPDVDAFAAFIASLQARHYHPGRYSLVQVARTADVRRLHPEPCVSLASKPDAAWGKVFLGVGFDPVDGASRVRSISRATDAVYASIIDEDGSGEAIAVGAASFGFGWASIHGMRTARARRGQGLAGRIISAFAQAALDRGYERMFLQVEEDNPGARSLYARAGFATVWRYAYWQPQDQ